MSMHQDFWDERLSVTLVCALLGAPVVSERCLLMQLPACVMLPAFNGSIPLLIYCTTHCTSIKAVVHTAAQC